MKNKLLLHTCCAPCSTYVVDKLRKDGYNDITAYWYNINIHPFTEYKMRLDTLKEYAKNINLPLVVDYDYGIREFTQNVSGNIDARCYFCYYSRLECTVKYAKENGYDSFSTTLLVSPYQKHEMIVKIANELALKYDIEFVYQDFRDGFRIGQQMARDAGLYMQKYCGCIYSEEDRYIKQIEKGKKENVKYLILDFGMVLAYPPTGNWHLTSKFLQLIDMSKLDNEKLKKSFEKNKEILDRKVLDLEEEYNMFFEFYNNILVECEYPEYDPVIAEQIAYNRTYESDKYKPYDGIKEELKRLSQKYKLILLTDNWPDVIFSLKQYGIYNLFTKIYVSSMYGQLKKDGDFFDNPINDFNIKSGEAIFIDDNENLLEIAKSKKLDVRLMDREMLLKNSKFKIISDLKTL